MSPKKRLVEGGGGAMLISPCTFLVVTVNLVVWGFRKELLTERTIYHCECGGGERFLLE